MRNRLSLAAIVAVVGAGIVGFSAWTGLAAPNSRHLFADNSPNAVAVDTELVLAVDVSYSMAPDEQALQREGYIAGITSREFMLALKSGMHGKVAVTYFEWAGPGDHKIIVPWRLVDGPEAADAVANEIARAPYRRASRTSIASALQFAKPLFDASGYHGIRRVIDVSGDGANNSGPLVVPVRDEVVASGITINGLPILAFEPYLDQYFRDFVIGGPGAFMIVAKDFETFADAILKKLVIEIAAAPLPLQSAKFQRSAQ